MSEPSDLISHIVDLANGSTPFSDMHIQEGTSVMWRPPSGCEPTSYGIAYTEDVDNFLTVVAHDWKSSIKSGKALERAINLSSVRLRCSAYMTQCGTIKSISIRRLPLSPLSLEDTGLPVQATALVRSPKGLLLVSGTTGAGKTTTLASIAQRISETRSGHIITIEDPIEYILKPGKSIISQREVGEDVTTFTDGLREAMRQRPDVILIGEIRDRDTAETALRAAESGCFVMATVHARNTVSSIQKMVSFFPDDAVSKAMTLSNVLVGALFQVLVPSLDNTKFVLATEMLLNNDPQVASAIADPSRHKSLEDKLKMNQIKQCQAMNAVLLSKVQGREISKDAALAASNSPDELNQMIGQK